MDIKLGNLGQMGLVRDVRPSLLPPAAFSDAGNVRFLEGAAEKVLGYAEVVGSPAVLPIFVQLCRSYSNNFWVYIGTGEAHAFDDNDNTAEITNAGADYQGSLYDRWVGTSLNGIPIFTNGVDVPQQWATVQLATALTDLSNWNANWTCRGITAFRNFLVAYDITKSSTRYGNMVKWSKPAEAGAVPTSWDETDPTTLAGETLLASTQDNIVWAKQLRDTLIVYKEFTTWMMRYVGGTYIFRFDEIFQHIGAMGPYCAQALTPSQHIVLTRDDIVQHDGVQATSMIDSRLRRWLGNNIDSGASYLSLVVPFMRRNEVWVCIPLAGSNAINTALVWNKISGTWSVRDLPEVRAFDTHYPYRTNVGDSWDGDTTTTWDGETTEIWDDPKFITTKERTLFASAGETQKIYELSDTLYTDDGADYVSFVERTDLTIKGVDRDGNLVMDEEEKKQVNSIWPQFEAATGTTFQIKLGVRDGLDEDITWSDAQTYTVGTSLRLDFYVTGRYFSYRIEDEGSVAWKLKSVTFDLLPVGRF